MKKQLFVFSFMIAMISNVIAFDERSMFDETSEASKWTFVENQFITKIASAKATFWAHAGAITTAAIALSGLANLSYLYATNSTNQKFTENPFAAGNVCGGVTALSAGVLAIQALECHISARTNRNAVESFFANWDQNQFFIPTELQDAFDLMAEVIELDGKEAILNNAGEIVELVQFHVMRHFEGRYKGMLDLKAYDGLNTDAKTAFGIIKGIVATSKDLGGSSKS